MNITNAINASASHIKPPEPGGITHPPGNIPAPTGDDAELLQEEPLYIQEKAVVRRGLQCRTCNSIDVRCTTDERRSTMVVKCSKCGAQATDFNQGLFRAVAIRQRREQGSDGAREQVDSTSMYDVRTTNDERRTTNDYEEGTMAIRKNELLKIVPAMWANIAPKLKEMGIGSTTLARLAKTSTSTIHYIRTCSANRISKEVLSRIAAVLGVELEDLIKEPAAESMGQRTDNGGQGAGVKHIETKTIDLTAGVKSRSEVILENMKDLEDYRRAEDLRAKIESFAPIISCNGIVNLDAIFLVNFCGYEDLLEELKTMAKEDFRTPEEEILYCVEQINRLKKMKRGSEGIIDRLKEGKSSGGSAYGSGGRVTPW